jgi:hypothetical protein
MPDRRPLRIADDLNSLPLPPEAAWIRARRRPRNRIVWAAAGSAALVVIAAVLVSRPSVAPIDEKDPGTLAAQPVATPEPSHELPSRCDVRVALPARTASSVAWKADGQELAITETTDGRSQVVVLRGPDWQGRTLGAGSDPKWSASGTRIAFARGATIVIADVASGREVATVTPAAPGYGWSGDTLVYWGGSSLRGWRDGVDARFGAHVPDLTPLTGPKDFSFSADGSRFAVVDRDGKVLYGGTADGRVSPLPSFEGVRWSTAGANVLLNGKSVAALVRPQKLIFPSASLPPRFALWSPDGSQALFGSDPSGAAWNVIGWDGQKMGASVELASGFRSGAFSFDGAYLASIYDDGLRIYRCARDSATSSGLITRAQAKQVIERSGALIKVNLEDSKLIRWADISGTLTGTWAVVQPEASGIEPTAPVWLLMYAGEAKQPAGANFESSPGVRSPTVNLVFYVLDAKTGKELGARVASGTWWIGQPFESLTDRAPDATPHPFEPSRNTIPPMPTPRPTASPATSSAGAGMARVESALGGWRMDFPDGWWPSRNGFAGVTLGTRDPDLGIASSVGLETWFLTASALRVELWANPDQLSAEAWSAGTLGGTIVTKNTESSPVTIAGKAALVLRQSVGPQPPDNHFDSQKVWVVPAERPDRMLVITAQLGEGVYAAEMDAAVTSLALFPPQPAVSSVDMTREDVLGRWKNASPAPGRVEAKLVTWAEAATLEKASGWNRLDRDPDSLVWIVAVSAIGAEPGFGLSSRGGRLGAGPQDPPRWQMYVTAANSNDDGAGMWGQLSSNGDWPPGFDALKDRCC